MLEIIQATSLEVFRKKNTIHKDGCMWDQSLKLALNLVPFRKPPLANINMHHIGITESQKQNKKLLSESTKVRMFSLKLSKIVTLKQTHMNSSLLH